MKKIYFILFVTINAMSDLSAQTENKHFTRQITETGSSYFLPVGETNEVVKKGEALLDVSLSVNVRWTEQCIVKPFQELIDAGVFSKQRMQELEDVEKMNIELYFDETGIVEFVCFWLYKEERSLLTDDEMLAICNKYKGVKFDLSSINVLKTTTGSKAQFYVPILFEIPFKDLEY